MTSCKEISCESKKKKTVFQVEIDIEDMVSRERVIIDLRDIGLNFADQLANIIEKG